MLKEFVETVLLSKEILTCKVATTKKGWSKGFAYLEVRGKDSVQKALQLHGSKLGNRSVLVAIKDKTLDRVFVDLKNTVYIEKISPS